MFKRIALFLATNLAVLVLLGIVLTILQNVFGINLGDNGTLLLFAAVFGFGGSFISLMISKWSAKRATGMQLIESPKSELEQWLVSTVRRQADKAGIKMPEVGIYDAPEINAFATGPSRNNALVAVSTGLLRSMTRDEAEAVLGHEVSHVANGDMVTMTLVQGVMNTFVIFLSRKIGGIINGDSRGLGYFATIMALDILFGLFASVITMWFSRHREYRADAGGAALAGKDKMIAALQRLAQNHGQSSLPTEIAAFGISGSLKSGLASLLMSHPPLEVRIQALRDAP
jgi:heat shock protein HtpX